MKGDSTKPDENKTCENIWIHSSDMHKEAENAKGQSGTAKYTGSCRSDGVRVHRNM